LAVRGLTAVEVIVVLALFSLLLVSVTGLLISQQRYYMRNADVASTRSAARLAAELLASELRGLNVAGGDLYGFAADSLAIRSTTGIGIVCGFSGRTLAVRRISGVFGDLPTDSARLFVEHATGLARDDEWLVASIEASRAATLPVCPDGAPPDRSLVLDRDLEGISVGSPLRSFRPYVYRLYVGGDGDWWLGQRLRHGRLQPVTGPLAPPGDGGLRLTFADESGVSTADPAAVARVAISVTARGRVRYPWRGVRTVFKDSVTTVVWVRGY
jgi:hypothetical protein